MADEYVDTTAGEQALARAHGLTLPQSFDQIAALDRHIAGPDEDPETLRRYCWLRDALWGVIEARLDALETTLQREHELFAVHMHAPAPATLMRIASLADLDRAGRLTEVQKILSCRITDGFTLDEAWYRILGGLKLVAALRRDLEDRRERPRAWSERDATGA